MSFNFIFICVEMLSWQVSFTFYCIQVAAWSLQSIFHISIISKIWYKHFPFLNIQNRWLLTARCIKYIRFLTLAYTKIAALTNCIILIAWINCWIVADYCLTTNLLITLIYFVVTFEVILEANHVSHERWIRGLNIIIIIHEANISVVVLDVATPSNHTRHRIHKSRCNTPNIARTVYLAYS